MFKRFLLKEVTQEELFQKVFVEKLTMRKPTLTSTGCICNCPDEYYAIMMLCWEYDADKRPRFEDLQRVIGEYLECIQSKRLEAELRRSRRRSADHAKIAYLRKCFRVRIKKGKYQITK